MERTHNIQRGTVVQWYNGTVCLSTLTLSDTAGQT